MKLSLLGLGCSFALLGCANAQVAQSPDAATPEPAPVADAQTPEEAPPIAQVQSNPMLDQAMQRYAARDYLLSLIHI